MSSRNALVNAFQRKGQTTTMIKLFRGFLVALLLLQPFLLIADDDTEPVVGIISDEYNNLPIPSDATIMPAIDLPSSPKGPPGSGSSALPGSTNGLLCILAGDQINAPPNAGGAIGPTNHYSLFCLNKNSYITQDRDGTGRGNSHSTIWWQFTANSNSIPSSDWAAIGESRVLYDQLSGRWIVVSCSNEGTNTAANMPSLLIGVSTNGFPVDPTRFWKHAYELGPTNVWIGNPNVGFNKDWIVVQVNLFLTNANTFVASRIYVFNKTNLYGNGTNYTMISVDPTNGPSQVPAVTYDASLNKVYLVQNWNSTNGVLRLYSIAGDIGSEQLVLTNGYCSATAGWASQPTGGMDFAPQQDVTNLLQAGDARIQNVVYRSGSIWCAQTVFFPINTPTNNPSRSAVQWWEITTNAIPLQVGLIQDTSGGTNFAYPSIAVDRYKDVFIGYSSFSTNEYASAECSYRKYDDALKEMPYHSVIKSGLWSYVCPATTNHTGSNNFWAGYTASFVDPIDDSFWSLQPYAAGFANTNVTYTNQWALWWYHFSMPPQSNDMFSAALVLNGPTGSTNSGNVRATFEPGELLATNGFGATVWFRWTASNSAPVVFDTIGSDFDTILSIYTGTSVSNLTVITNNDNDGGTFTSRVIFNAVSNTTYYIAVDGVDGSSYSSMGHITLNWTQLAPVFIQNPQKADVLAGTNVTFSCTAIGTPSPTFQWQKDGSAISGATDTVFTKLNVQTNDTGDYSVIATNSHGSATSAVAHLQVYDSAAATLSGMLIDSGQFQFVVSGLTGGTYTVDISTNLIDWTAVSNGVATFAFTNSTLTNDYQFFRARYQP